MTQASRRRWYVGSALALMGLSALLESPKSWVGAHVCRPLRVRGLLGATSPKCAGPSGTQAATGHTWAALAAGVTFGAWAAALASGRASCRRSRAARAALPDGTNEEGEDLQEPLALKLEEVSGVVLYGNDFSPPCRKIQTMLNYYKVPFQTVSGRHPTSDYKKIPVLEMSGRQINDSHIIVKNLVPVLTGEPFTPAQLDWEKRITFEFQPSIEVELFGNGPDFARAAGLDGWKGSLAVVFSPVLGFLIGSVFRSRYGDFPASATFGKQFLEACGERPFFHGSTPGPVDLSLYGTYEGLARKGCETVDSFLDGSGLRPWHDRMEEATGAATKAPA